MAKQAFIRTNFRARTVDTINKANTIIATYAESGLKLTLRQLYYQFVSRNWIENKERSYKNLGNAISEGRLAGLIDWDAIEDRIRRPSVPLEFDGVQHLVANAINWYRLPRWRGQENYVELWVEKDALAGVLSPIADEYHVTLMVNRGYSSQSAMYESANRFIRAKRKGHRNFHLLYLGDHDPSGEDMVRDVTDRLETFGVNLEVEKIALTMDQVDEFNPPPNPTKMTDSRASGYVAKHGASSWEVDALPPDELTAIIRRSLDQLVDQTLIDEIKISEEEHKAALIRAAKRIK